MAPGTVFLLALGAIGRRNMGTRRLRYIEFDGQVYLVRRDEAWTFPDESESLPFEVDERHRTSIRGREVSYCRARLDRFPSEWTFKDDVPGMEDVDPVVRQAINASLPRCVVGVLALDPRGRLLMVKSNRGFTKGMWNIPGGFIDYGEHPEEAAVREVEEETGVRVRLGGLVGVYQERFQSPYFMYGFIYEGHVEGGALRADPQEIEAVDWMTPERAHAETRNPFARSAMQKRFRITPTP